MSYKLIFRPDAVAEAQRGYDYYEEQSPGTGPRFQAALDATLSKIGEQPKIYAKVGETTRRAILRNFPYAVFYRIHGDDVIVLAVMHGRRHPSRWQSRAEG